MEEIEELEDLQFDQFDNKDLLISIDEIRKSLLTKVISKNQKKIDLDRRQIKKEFNDLSSKNSTILVIIGSVLALAFIGVLVLI